MMNIELLNRIKTFYQANPESALSVCWVTLKDTCRQKYKTGESIAVGDLRFDIGMAALVLLNIVTFKLGKTGLVEVFDKADESKPMRTIDVWRLSIIMLGLSEPEMAELNNDYYWPEEFRPAPKDSAEVLANKMIAAIRNFQYVMGA